MLEVSNIEVYDLRQSVISCRNSMRTETPDYSDDEFEKSFERAKKLAPLDGGHNNFLCGIRVSFDLKYPNYISPELQRYHFLDIVNSQSKMHKIMHMNFDKCCNKYVNEQTINNMKSLISEYNTNQCYTNFMRVISNCPQGIELFMRCSTNYLQLRNIYKQRKSHKLKEDWGAFCNFIEKLPFANDFILC